MPIDKIMTVLNEISNIEDNKANRFKIEAYLVEILAYLNRDEITDDMLPAVAFVISECLSSANSGNIKSLSEGDMSVSFLYDSPFFGKLDAFKLIRGIK